MGCPQRLLESETDAYLFFSDCNETDSVIKESVTLAKSKDFRQDKLTAMSLLQRHKHLQSIEGDVARVKENGQKLMNSQFKLGQRGRAKDRFRGGEETRDGEGRP